MNTTAQITRPATPAQFALLRDLLTQVEAIDPEVARQSRNLLNASRETGRFDAKFASEAIEGFLTWIKANRPALAKADARPNRFAGRCAGCGEQVEAEAGVLEGTKGAWKIWHKEGECPVGEVEGVPAGRYAVTVEGTLKFYVLKANGKLYAQASDELHPVRSTATRTLVLDLIRVDVEGALRTYGREIGACSICGRTLTTESSRQAGIGPICERSL